MKARFVASLLLCLACAGCASLPPLPATCEKIGPAGAICPLPPSALPKVEASHLVTVTHQGQSHTFLGRLEIDDKALRLAGASLFGTHLFTITWDGRTVASQPPEPDMHPKLMVAMLEVALADPALLRPQLHGMTLTLERKDGVETRELVEHGHLVAHIERRGATLATARLSIRIPPADLSLQLKPLQAPAEGAQP
ncbi:MAG TPA: DUF3261 domain-containing protein [Oleiagrimonas sp.]|nr:DUF3261 domain-containing protein [Oleiagrimonas sp.]HET7359997.1 DUF3261 domain-containing protein [Rhodanobacteraceae bacterium]